MSNKLLKTQNHFIIFLLFVVAMILFRVLFSGSLRYTFLGWNIFLAFVPYYISTHILLPTKSISKAVVFMIWLLFFPNALYIITDLIHLKKTGIVPIWYDAILLFSAAFSGLILAYASLLNIEVFLEKHVSQRYLKSMVFSLIFAGSFGVYLGRFQRWNSWDIISDPLMIFTVIGERFINPLDHLRTWAVTFLLTFLFFMGWLMIKSFLSQPSVNKLANEN